MSDVFELIPGLRRLTEMELEELHGFEREMRERAIPAIQRAIRDREQAAEDARRRMAESITVDRSAVVLTNGSPVTPDHRELTTSGQQKAYVILSDEERAKGFVRPVRRTYLHVACGTTTTMGRAIAETYARDPKFYGGTFCCGCGKHFPLVIDDVPQFTWIDGSAVGS